MSFLSKIQKIAKDEMEFFHSIPKEHYKRMGLDGTEDDDELYEHFLVEFIGEIPLGHPLEKPLDFDWAFPIDWKTLDECFLINQKFIEHYGWGYGQPQDTYELLLRYTIYQIREGEKDLFRDMWKLVTNSHNSQI